MAEDDAREQAPSTEPATAEASERAAENKRKLEEHLARLNAGKVSFEKGERDFSKFHPRGEASAEGAAGRATPRPPPQPPGWEAWKSAHKGRIHTLSDADREQMGRLTDYGLLDLKPGASKEEVRKAFNTLAKKHHPDLGGDGEIFQAMRAAHDRILKE